MLVGTSFGKMTIYSKTRVARTWEPEFGFVDLNSGRVYQTMYATVSILIIFNLIFLLFTKY